MPDLIDDDSSCESSDEDSTDSNPNPVPCRTRHNRTPCESDSSEEPILEACVVLLPPTVTGTIPSFESGAQDADAVICATQSNRLWEIAHVVEVLARWHALDVPDDEEDPICTNG